MGAPSLISPQTQPHRDSSDRAGDTEHQGGSNCPASKGFTKQVLEDEQGSERARQRALRPSEVAQSPRGPGKQGNRPQSLAAGPVGSQGPQVKGWCLSDVHFRKTILATVWKKGGGVKLGDR